MGLLGLGFSSNLNDKQFSSSFCRCIKDKAHFQLDFLKFEEGISRSILSFDKLLLYILDKFSETNLAFHNHPDRHPVCPALTPCAVSVRY